MLGRRFQDFFYLMLNGNGKHLRYSFALKVNERRKKRLRNVAWISWENILRRNQFFVYRKCDQILRKFSSPLYDLFARALLHIVQWQRNEKQTILKLFIEALRVRVGAFIAINLLCTLVGWCLRTFFVCGLFRKCMKCLLQKHGITIITDLYRCQPF